MPALLNQCEWRVTATTGPCGRIGHTFCASEDGHMAFVYGGLSANDEEIPNYLEDFWAYNVETKTWKEVELGGMVQSPRAFHTTVWYDNRMYIFGGCNGRGRFNKLFYILPNGACIVPPVYGTAPLTRYCHSAVVYNGAMYVYGGKCGGRNSNRRLNDLNFYNITGENACHWNCATQLGTPPEARSAHSAVVHRDSMLVFGGRNCEGSCCDDVQSYNFQTFMWRRYDICSSPFSRARNSCVTHNGMAILFGGWNGRRKMNDLIFFHMDSGTIEKIDQLFPSIRECQVAVMCHDTMIVFGGRLRGEFMRGTLEVNLGPTSVADATITYFTQRNISLANDLARIPFRLQQSYQARLPVEVNSSDSIGPEVMEGAQDEPDEANMTETLPMTLRFIIS
eukprot:gene3874-2746_t